MFKNNNKKLNRRAAFRIYEQANLFYQKIDPAQAGEFRRGFDGVLHSKSRSSETDKLTSNVESVALNLALPYSQSQENDTLNVNISSTGIAFTCKDKLKIGDYLIIRVLLLSNMTLVMTCCKVVYCRPSNPYEKNQYPFLVGVEFVNLTAGDSRLLKSHVGNKRKQKLILTGIMSGIFMLILAMPEEVFSFVLDLSDDFLDLIVEIIFVVFNYIGLGLDYIVQYLFQISPHGRQVVEFYIMTAIQLAALIGFLRLSVSASMRLGNNFVAYLRRKKASLLYYWRRQTLLNKIKITGIGVLAISCYVLLAI